MIDHLLVITTTFVLTLAFAAPPAADEFAAIQWIRENAIELKTAAPGHGFKDMQPLAGVVGNARIVSLGESTHGTREIFQMKHRMFEFLVEEMGFTLFGIEASYPECEAINEYIQTGAGDPSQALHGQHFWTWDTEEVLELIEWIRAYNADPAHKNKLRFYGFDMQNPRKALDVALEALGAADAAEVEDLRERLAPLQDEMISQRYQQLDGESREALTAAAADLLKAIDRHREALVSKESDDRFETFRRHAVIVMQYEELLRNMAGLLPPVDGVPQNVRDRAMADNIAWILERHPGEKIALWAHNGHVSKRASPHGTGSMGSNLEHRFGDEHVVFGFSFNQGGFQAIFRPHDGQWDGGPSLRPFRVGLAMEGSIDRTFAYAGMPIFVLDVRETPQPPEGEAAAAWLRSPHPMRMIGAIFSLGAEHSFYQPTILPDCYDAIIFIETTTSARPNPLTRKKFGMPEEE